MSDWTSALKGDPVPWLLEEDNPSVRYFTMVDILEMDRKDKRVAAAKKEIMTRGIVPKILSGQKEGGYWENPEDFYVRTKYQGTVWQLIILAELGADGRDPRVRKAGDFVLQYSQDRQSGGFSYRGTSAGGGQHSGVIPCLTGNMVWSLIRLGRLHDVGVKRGIDWLATYARFDDGETRPPKSWPYERWEQCWGKHTCHSAAAKFLKALAEIPEGERSTDVRRVIAEASEYFLKHRIFKRSHDLERPLKPKWTKLGFPTMWDGDALEVFGILARLGCRDPRMQDAADLIISKQDGHGRWLLENTYNGKFRANIDTKDRPSQWATLQALRALKNWMT